MRLRIGILDASYGAPPAGYTLNPVNYEDDWTLGSIPAGWTQDTTPPYAAGVYSGNGTHVGLSEFYYKANKSITPRPIGAYVWIVGYYIDGSNGVTAAGLVRNDLTEPPSYEHSGLVSQTNSYYGDVTVPILLDSDQWGSPTPRAATTKVAWGPTTAKMVVKALTLDSTGKSTSYLFTSEGYVIKSTINSVPVPFAPAVETISSFEVGINFDGVIGSSESEFCLTNTYVGIDEELDQTAITAIATGWGWTAASFVAGSPEQTNTAWTTTAMPTNWNANTTSFIGTPFYAADGTYGSDSSVGDQSGLYQDTAKVYVDKVTLIMAHKYSGPSETGLTFGISESNGNYITCFADSLNPLIYTGSFQDSSGTPIGLLPVAATGTFHVGLVVDFSAATWSFYLIEDGETTQVLTGSSETLPTLVTAIPWVTLTGSADTPSDSKLVHTYVGLGETLNQAAIESIASGWGWTP